MNHNNKKNREKNMKATNLFNSIVISEEGMNGFEAALGDPKLFKSYVDNNSAEVWNFIKYLWKGSDRGKNLVLRLLEDEKLTGYVLKTSSAEKAGAQWKFMDMVEEADPAVITKLLKTGGIIKKFRGEGLDERLMTLIEKQEPQVIKDIFCMKDIVSKVTFHAYENVARIMAILKKSTPEARVAILSTDGVICSLISESTVGADNLGVSSSIVDMIEKAGPEGRAAMLGQDGVVRKLSYFSRDKGGDKRILAMINGAEPRHKGAIMAHLDVRELSFA